MRLPAPTPHVLGPDGEPDRDARIRILIGALEHRGIEGVAVAILALDHLDLLLLSGVLLCVAEAAHPVNAPAIDEPELSASLRASKLRQLAQRCARLAVDRYCSSSGVYAGAREALAR